MQRAWNRWTQERHVPQPIPISLWPVWATGAIPVGMRAPHQFKVKCPLCGGRHATNSKGCAAKYRKYTQMAAPKGAKNNTAKQPATPHPTHVTSNDNSLRENEVNSTQAPPSGLAEKR
ncbi:hypothetical protein HPB50_018416 [Hyalomma asiaticum]|uniref:Uncharacterized protein n=1 Tax=Hyalomma asiaticum TaxID=266040 RepID=A0ACB7TAF9_HYAAI|nr:hypothetical protein HPB50_018416 [Hyalomma asiaticum]